MICCPVRRPVAKSALFTSDGQIVCFSRGKEMGLATKRGFMESFKMAKIKKMPAQSAKKQSGVRKRTRRGKVAIHVQRRGHLLLEHNLNLVLILFALKCTDFYMCSHCSSSMNL